MFQFIANSFWIAAAGLIQMTDLAFIGGIKVNLTLAVIAPILYFDRSWKRRVLYALIGGIALKTSPLPGPEAWLFVLAAFVMGIFADYLPWRGYINTIVAITAGTLIMNAQSFLLSAFAPELGYNLAAGLAIFIIFSTANEKPSRA